MNVSSVVVKAAPENLESVVARLKSSGLCDLHFQDRSGKIIITIEGSSISEEMDKMKAVMNIPGVLCADLAYSYSENEMERALGDIIAKGGCVPEPLMER